MYCGPTVIREKVGYHGWTEFWYVWLKFDWYECLGRQVFGQALTDSCAVSLTFWLFALRPAEIRMNLLESEPEDLK